MGDEKELEDITATGARTIARLPALWITLYPPKEYARKNASDGYGDGDDHAFWWKGKYDVVLGMEMLPKSLEEMKEFVKATKLLKGALSEGC